MVTSQMWWVNNMYTVPESIALNPELKRLLDILRKHPGKANRISMIELYETWVGRKIKRNELNKPIENVATLSRSMRLLINELIMVYAIPIMSSTSGGYWIIANTEELEEVYHQDMSRALSTIQKATKRKKISLVDAVQQLALDLGDDNPFTESIAKYNSSLDLTNLTLSREARMSAITKHLKDMFDSPQQYADQIQQLQAMFGPKLIPPKILMQINSQVNQLQKLSDQAKSVAGNIQTLLEVSI